MAPLTTEAWCFPGIHYSTYQETGHAKTSLSAAPLPYFNIQGIESQSLSPTLSEAATPKLWDPAGPGGPGSTEQTGCQGWGVVGQRSL